MCCELFALSRACVHVNQSFFVAVVVVFVNLEIKTFQ